MAKIINSGLIKSIKTIGIGEIIDFNASINFEQWNYFIDRIDKNNLFGIKQRLKFPSKIPDLDFLNIADETFVKFGYEKIHEYGYSAFVYKPFASN